MKAAGLPSPTLKSLPSHRQGPESSADAEDAALVAQARAGSRPAFDALVRRYQRAVRFLVLHYVRDEDDAADVAQTTFIRAHARLAELRGVTMFRRWLFRIAINASLNWLRDHARFVNDDDASAKTPVPEIGTERLEAREDAAVLRAAVERLPGKQRAVLQMRVYRELPFRAIAQALGTSEGAAKVCFHYAARKLRAELGPEGRDDPPPAQAGSGGRR